MYKYFLIISYSLLDKFIGLIEMSYDEFLLWV
jgi:hypothetical protein